jgi:glycosyltransferase involved in cell wall biosynthesis
LSAIPALRSPIHLWTPGLTGVRGGIAQLSRQVALTLQELAWPFVTISKSETASSWRTIPLPKNARDSTLRFILQAASATLGKTPKLIVSTHLNFGPLAHILSARARIPYVLFAHGVEVHPQLSARRIHALRSATEIWAVSDWTRQRVLALGGITESKVHVIPNTYDAALFPGPSTASSLHARYGITPGEPLILTVGRLNQSEQYKGQDRLIQALPLVLKQFPTAKLLIIGEGNDRPRLEAMVATQGLKDSVRFAGFVPETELAEHYQMASVFAMPSTGEGFGIVYLEALACGTPVVAGHADGSKDALQNGKFGFLIDPTSVPEIATALCRQIAQEGTAWWYQPDQVRQHVQETFGPAVFKANLQQRLKALCPTQLATP